MSTRSGASYFVLVLAGASAAACTIKPMPGDDMGEMRSVLGSYRPLEQGGFVLGSFSPRVVHAGSDASDGAGGDSGMGEGPNGEGAAATGGGSSQRVGAPYGFQPFPEDVTPEPCGNTIHAVVRDFHADHTDFEGVNSGDEKGLVLEQLGADRKPVFARDQPSSTISGPAAFYRFYRNTENVNLPFNLDMVFAPTTTDSFSFASDLFFPLDDQAFGDEGNPHNYHFTTEIHTQFLYRGGEHFSISGDDDVWIFVNGFLVADLGGLHSAEDADVQLDAVAAHTGLQAGRIYPFEMFHAERHTISSTFRADTDLQFVDCGGYFPGN
jgi:fibro-slime domain-containing protein